MNNCGPSQTQTLGDESSPYPTVRIVVRDELRRVLLVQWGDGRWRLPEGWVSPRESVADCVERTMRVMTGLEVIRARPLDIYSTPKLCASAHPAEASSPSLTVNFVIEPGDWFGLPRPDGVEVMDARFFAPDDPGLPEVGAVNRELLKDLACFDGRVVVK